VLLTIYCAAAKSLASGPRLLQLLPQIFVDHRSVRRARRQPAAAGDASYGTGHGFSFQISAAYWAMVRLLEEFP
jgi:hypothetical protein